MAKSKTQRKNRQFRLNDRNPKALHPRSWDSRERALKALAAMRGGDTLSRAARDNGVTTRTIKRYVGSALVEDRPGGRVRATKSDRLVRYLQIPGPNGPRDVSARRLRTASQFAQYKAAINRLLRGDRNAMAACTEKRFRESNTKQTRKRYSSKLARKFFPIRSTVRFQVVLRETDAITHPLLCDLRINERPPGAPPWRISARSIFHDHTMSITPSVRFNRNFASRGKSAIHQRY